MIKRELLAMISMVLMVSCQDSPPPTAPVHRLATRTANLEYPVLGPTVLGNGQEGTFFVDPCPEGPKNWSIPPELTSIGTGCSAVWSSTTNFNIIFRQGFAGGGGLEVEIWEGCDPEVGSSDPDYCDAEIIGADGADLNQQCTWEVLTNMPPQVTVVKWYVNNVLQHTGPVFEYSHPSYGSFDLYMTADAPYFGSRDDEESVTVSQQSNCLL
jgi:hypothetical protein